LIRFKAPALLSSLDSLMPPVFPSGLPLTEHKILFFGSGSAGVGVAKQLLSFFTLLGLSEEEAKSRIYVCETYLWATSIR
jgi:malic enzyme